VKEGSVLMVACVALLAALSLAGGIAICGPASCAMKAAQQMLSGMHGAMP